MTGMATGRSNAGRAAEALLLRLGSFAPLAADEIALVRGLAETSVSIPAGTVLAPAGLPPQPGFLLSGWACRRRILRDGRRQILRLILAGDCLVPLVHPLGAPAPCDTVALTRVEVADAAAVVAVMHDADTRRSPGLRAACAGAAREEELHLLDRIVSLGRQTAYERLGHLLLEFHERLSVVGHTIGDQFRMPLTQEALGDVLGLSAVHVNRVVQQMRREHVADISGGWVTISNRPVLAAHCDFRGAG